ncbi:MAG: (Fe-S)-binding protein [Polyangiaceae bacterium]
MTAPRRLRMLEERAPELETCVYCPKLCRAACPVSDAEASDTVTPWGQMSALHRVARGAAEASPEYAALSFACSGCRGCRERCDHHNPVPETLFEARAVYREQGLAPPAVTRFHDGFSARLSRVRARIDSLRERHGHAERAATALVVGCDYALHLDAELDDGVAAARALFGPLRIAAGCCGMPLEAAGDPARASALRSELRAELSGATRALAFDAGCAFALAADGVVPFARAAEQALREPPHALGKRAQVELGPLRYHDPCYLARGLGETQAPRALLRRFSGHAPAEFSRREAHTRCSGGGALLPITRPETRARIAEDRVQEHQRLGGGTIVTACAASLRSLRAAGANVVDLLTIVRRLAGP